MAVASVAGNGVSPLVAMTNTTEHIEGRALAYALFARFLSTGLTPEVHRQFEVVEELAPLLPAELDEREWASAHFDVFGFNVIPHAGWYLDSQGLLGRKGPAEAAASSIRSYVGPKSDPGDDGVASQLSLLATMCELQARGRDNAVDQREYLDTYFLWWFFPFAVAITRCDKELYSAVARLMIDVVLDHRGDLGQGDPPESPLDERTDPGIGELAANVLAEYLTVASQAGFVFTRSRIEEVARTANLPRGFGDRRQMLLNLLRSSTHYDEDSNALRLIIDECRSWKERYEAVKHADPGISAVSEVINEWLRRLDLTIHFLESAAFELFSSR